MANSIDPRATPGAGSTHPVQQRPSAPATDQRPVPDAQAFHPIASAGVAPLSADRVAPGSANPRIAKYAAKVPRADPPAVFCDGDVPLRRSLGSAFHQVRPDPSAPPPLPHLTTGPSKPSAFDPRAQDFQNLHSKRSPSP